MASAWEMQIKSQLEKLTLEEPLSEIVGSQASANAIDVLSVELNHIYALENLPAHHRDPFDRLLIAQSIAEDLVIMSRDASFGGYPVEVVW